MKRSIVSPGFVKRTLAKLLKLDQQLGIVVDGNVASKAIAVGKYVNLINSTINGKPDGIYVATGAVSKGGTVTAADISGDAVADGVTNDLSEQIANISFSDVSTKIEFASDGASYISFVFKNVNGENIMRLIADNTAMYLQKWNGSAWYGIKSWT